MKVECPGCGREYGVPSSAMGKSATCKCGERFSISERTTQKTPPPVEHTKPESLGREIRKLGLGAHLFFWPVLAGGMLVGLPLGLRGPNYTPQYFGGALALIACGFGAQATLWVLAFGRKSRWMEAEIERTEVVAVDSPLGPKREVTRHYYFVDGKEYVGVGDPSDQPSLFHHPAGLRGTRRHGRRPRRTSSQPLASRRLAW